MTTRRRYAILPVLAEVRDKVKTTATQHGYKLHIFASQLLLTALANYQTNAGRQSPKNKEVTHGDTQNQK